MAYGGQKGWGLDLNTRRNYTEPRRESTDSVGRTLAPVDPEDATYEAERDEVIVGDMDRDGMAEMLVFGGKPHSKGGTPAKEEGFIFSNTKALKLKGEIVSKFGKTPNKKGYTPADLAKQYDLNKYKAIIDDPNGDPLAKKTAKLMLDNYNNKLADLAMVQESMKGFPQGIPDIAQEKYGQQPQLTQPQVGPQAAYGGMYKMQTAGQTPSWFNPWMKSNTEKGRTSPTGKSTVYDPAVGNINYDDYNYWKGLNGNWDFESPEQMQKFMFDRLQKDDSEAYNEMVNYYGMPAAGKLDDGYIGARSVKALKHRFKTPQGSTQVVETPKQSAAAAGTPKETAAKEEYQMQEGEDPQYVGPQGRLPYNRFDVANILSAIASPVKSYAPRMFRPNMEEVQGVYDQPDYNPLLAAANTRAQMNQTFGNAGAAMAANTYNPELMQGLIQETGRARGTNLQLANSIAGQNNQIRNQREMLNAQLMQDNYDKWVKTQEETDIAEKLKWRKDVMPAIQHAENQRTQMERYNAMFPQYAVSGPEWAINFTKGKSKGDQASSPTEYSLSQFFKENPELKDIFDKGDTKDKLEVNKMFQQRAREHRALFGKNPKNLQGNVANLNALQSAGLLPRGTSRDPYDVD